MIIYFNSRPNISYFNDLFGKTLGKIKPVFVKMKQNAEKKTTCRTSNGKNFPVVLAVFHPNGGCFGAERA